jgi:protein-disulfide isomerase
MSSLRRFVVAFCAGSLAFGLAACKDDATADSGPPKGEPIAHVAAPAGQSWVETAAETPDGGFVIGNPNAPLKLVEYASHTCHVCAAFSKEGAAGMDKYVDTGVVSYEIRNLIRDPVDLTISLLARCSGPAAFHPIANQVWQNFDELMNVVQSNGAAIQATANVPPAQRFQAIAQASGLLPFFAARGISNDQAMQCLADTAKAEQIASRSQAQSDELQLTGTPTFFLNGQRIEGTSWAALEPILQAAGAR